MSKREKRREAVMKSASVKNITFEELCLFVEDLGFIAHKGSGTSHRVYAKTGVVEIINLQEDNGGKAKPYQVRQVRKIVLAYHL